MSLAHTIKTFQWRHGLTPDGMAGPKTWTVINQIDGQAPEGILVVSEQSLDMIYGFEIVSGAYYRRHLQSPTWPGGLSGITLAVGYDLGYQTIRRVELDWEGRVHDDELDLLLLAVGQKGEDAKDFLAKMTDLRAIVIPLETAQEVFYLTSMPHWAAKVRRAFPGIELLPADAQGAMLSVGSNRGVSTSKKPRRREMREIRGLTKLTLEEGGDIAKVTILGAIAARIRSMKRLWVDTNQRGLLKRRDREADLVAGADRVYKPSELVAL